jgi:tetratricopeptide (TPR) repeat protein
MGRLFGAGRIAIGQQMVVEADRFYHKGAGHQHNSAFTNRLFQRWGEAMHPSEHEHLANRDIGEMMPWLGLALKADPHNVENYAIAAYWLAEALQRPDLAMEVLLDAQRHNPGDYRVYSERARLLFGEDNDGIAARLLDIAIGLWRKGWADDEDAQLDIVQMLSYRAFLHEMAGERAQALAMFREASQRRPDSVALARRVLDMENGKDISHEDRRIWESVFKRRPPGCGHGEHAHGEHEKH